MFKEMSFTAKVAVGIAATAAVAAAGYGVYSYCATEHEKNLAKRLDAVVTGLEELHAKEQAKSVDLTNFSFIMELAMVSAMAKAYQTLVAEGKASLKEEQVATLEGRLRDLCTSVA